MLQMPYHEVMDSEAVGYNLRRLRKRHGWTVREVGARSGLSGATVSRLEAGRVTTESAGQLPALAAAFGVSVDELMRFPTPRHDARRYRVAGVGAANPAAGQSLSEDEDDGLFFLRVDGDCLVPELVSGAWLLMSAHKEAHTGDVVSVIVDGERHIKRVAVRNGQTILESTRGRLVLPAEGAVVEGVMIDKR